MPTKGQRGGKPNQAKEAETPIIATIAMSFVLAVGGASIRPANAQAPSGLFDTVRERTESELARPRQLQVDVVTLADWGVRGEIVKGKLPTLTITLDQRAVVASLPKIRDAGLVGNGAGENWAQTHPLTICRDFALAAMPVIMRDLYRDDDSLDYVPVYVFVDLPNGVSKTAELMFSFNSNRVLVRKLSGSDSSVPEDVGFGARIEASPWLAAKLAQEQP
jgi:hypothetical protein